MTLFNQRERKTHDQMIIFILERRQNPDYRMRGRIALPCHSRYKRRRPTRLFLPVIALGKVSSSVGFRRLPSAAPPAASTARLT